MARRQTTFREFPSEKWSGRWDLNPHLRGFRQVSWLPFVAHLRAYLLPTIQAVPSYCKHYFAFIGNNRQKNVCRRVSLVFSCVAFVSQSKLAGFCVGLCRLARVVFPLADQSKRRSWAECVRRRAIFERKVSGVAFDLAARRWRAGNAGRGRRGAPAPPAPALIHHTSNSGIEIDTARAEISAGASVFPGQP
jgi:hypothetical protein